MRRRPRGPGPARVVGAAAGRWEAPHRGLGAGDVGSARGPRERGEPQRARPVGGRMRGVPPGSLGAGRVLAAWSDPLRRGPWEETVRDIGKPRRAAGVSVAAGRDEQLEV